MKHKKHKRNLRALSNILIIGGIIILVKTFLFPLKEEAIYLYHSMNGTEYDVQQPQERGKLAQTFNKKQKQLIVPADPKFSIVIPKVNANVQVIPNVNAADETVYLDALNKGVAHAAGTAFPGEHGHIFLFAHSSDYFWNVQSYNAVFYLLYKLKKGEEINLFYKGRRHTYVMTGSTIVDPSEVDYITRKTPYETLTLQTCWPPGTTLKRLMVFAEPVAQ